MSSAKKTTRVSSSPLDGMRIDPAALRMIAARAALTVRGVLSLSVDADTVADPDNPGSLEKAILLQQKGPALRFTIRLNALFGSQLGPLALLVQKTVRKAVALMTDMAVDSVRVVFCGVGVAGRGGGAAVPRKAARASTAPKSKSKTTRKKQ